MASARQQLTRDWIQYLKNNQIAALQSNPKTGQLNYKRQPNITDLTTFLRKDFDEDQILDAIQTVVGQGGDDNETTGGELATQGSRDLSTWHQNEITPGTPQDQIGNDPTRQTQAKGKKYNTDDAEDAKYSQRGVTPYKGNDKPSTWFNKEMTPGQHQDQIGAQMPYKAKDKKYNTDDAEDAKYSQRGVKPYSNVPSTWMDKEITPAPDQERIGGQDQIGHQAEWQPKPKKYNTDNAQDVEVKDKTQNNSGADQKAVGMDPRAIQGTKDQAPKRKPKFKYRYKKGQLKEAIRDNQGAQVSEKEVQEIFKILSSQKPVQATGTNGSSPSGNSVPQQGAQASAPDRAEQEEQIRKLKRVIRDTMTDQQRAALYRALTDV